jgi:hypothetical protein
LNDWLDITPEAQPAKAGLPAVIVLPTDLPTRVALVEECWARLTLAQRTFLTTWRECRYNARAANRRLHNHDYTNSAHTEWSRGRDYATVMQAWRASAATEILDRDRLLARQDDLVETLMTPKPVLHQGIPVYHNGEILEEIEAGAAARANEAILDRVMPKPRADVEVNVGVAFTPVSVEVQKPATKVIDTKAEAIEVDFTLPPEAE